MCVMDEKLEEFMVDDLQTFELASTDRNDMKDDFTSPLTH